MLNEIVQQELAAERNRAGPVSWFQKNPGPGLVCVKSIGSDDLKVAVQQLVLFEEP